MTCKSLLPGTQLFHKKRGSEYVVVDTAHVQCDTPLVDYDNVVVYKDIKTGQHWVRSYSEVIDGRFDILGKPELP